MCAFEADGGTRVGILDRGQRHDHMVAGVIDLSSVSMVRDSLVNGPTDQDECKSKGKEGEEENQGWDRLRDPVSCRGCSRADTNSVA